MFYEGGKVERGMRFFERVFLSVVTKWFSIFGLRVVRHFFVGPEDGNRTVAPWKPVTLESAGQIY